MTAAADRVRVRPGSRFPLGATPGPGGSNFAVSAGVFVGLSEHHGSDDGYLPSPLVVAAAMAAVTRRIPISVSALVVNLHDPIRLAEGVAYVVNMDKLEE